MRTAQKVRSAHSALKRCERLLKPIYEDLDLTFACGPDWEQDSNRGYVAEEHVAALRDVLGAIATARTKMQASKAP